MKKSTKRILAIAGIVLSVFVISGCTNTFCSTKDTANILYIYDPGITQFYDEDDVENPREILKIKDDSGVYQNTNVFFEADYLSNSAITSLLLSAADAQILTPTTDYWVSMDILSLEESISYYNADHTTAKYDYTNLTAAAIKNEILFKLQPDGTTRYVNYGYAKFYGNNKVTFENWDKWTSQLKYLLGAENCPNSDFTALYKSTMNGYVSSIRTCISIDGGYYGHYGVTNEDKTQVYIEPKDWNYAWSRGFIEGLLVYPVAYMVEYFSTVFGMGGWGQIGAILLVTLIVRLILLLITFKATLSQTKMQVLQPELARIQAKYPNSKTNKAEQQRLAQEQMALYKKNKVSMFAPFLTLIIQFPIFIAVWGAMTGSASLSSDAVLGLRLSDSIGGTIANFANWPNNPGWWTALVLLLLMAGGQLVSMKLPTWMQKKKMKKMAKLGKNPAQTSQSKQMKWISNIMLVFIIVMGVMLPAAMGVYWFAGALISIAQAVGIQIYMNHKEKARKK